MINVETAREIARNHVQTLGINLTFFAEPITSGDYGWVFEYQSSTFIETNNVLDALAGNAPILIDSSKGHIFTLGTAHAVERYVRQYQRFGDPHASPGPTLKLIGWREGANKVEATKAIKVHTQLGLKDAKKAIDDCLNERKPIVRCVDPEMAAALALQLGVIGFEAKQLAL